MHIFSVGSIFAPGLTGQQPSVLLLYRAPYISAANISSSGVSRPTPSRQSAPSIPAPAGQYLPDIFLFHFYISRRGHSSIAKCFFCSFCFSNAKMRGTHFSASSRVQQTGIFAPGLTGRHHSVLLLYKANLSLPTASASPSGASRPTNTSRRTSFHTIPTISRQPVSFLPAWPSDALHISNLHLQPHHPNLFLPFFHFQFFPPTSSRSLSPRHSLPPFCCRLLSPQTKRETQFRARVQPARLPRSHDVRGDVGFATTGAERRPGEEPAFLFFFFLLSLFLFSSHSFPVSLAPRLRRDAFSFLFHFSFHFLFLFFIFFRSSFCFYFFIRDAFSFLFIFVLLFFFSFFSFLFYFFFFHFSFSFAFLFYFFASSFFSFLSCLQSISCSPFLPVLFFLPFSLQPLSSSSNHSPAIHPSFFFLFFFYPPSILPRPVQPAFRQPFLFLFLLFFLSSTITLTLSSSSPAAAERRKKIGKRILRERDALPGENGQREERQRDGMEPRGGGMEGVRKRCILCGKE